MVDVLAHLTAGTIAGMTGVLVDYPLDTIKTRMQVRCPSTPGSYMQCAARLYQQGGLPAFYRGLSVPFAAQGAEAAIVFSVYNTALHHFREAEAAALAATPSMSAKHQHHQHLQHLQHQQHQQQSAPSIWNSSAYWKASACAGLAVSVVLTPVEMLKCNMQMESSRPHWQRRHTTVRSLAGELYATNGIRSFYRGMTGTMTRAVFGNVAYFLSYEQCKQWLTQVSSSTASPSSSSSSAAAREREEVVPAWRSMLAGGISGCLYWSIAYPADVVKTQMQVCSKASAAGFSGTFCQFYRTGGVRSLYRGWGVTAVRAFVSSAVVFTTYERTFRFMRELGGVQISLGREVAADC